MTVGAAPWSTGAECGEVLPAFALALGELDDVTRARVAAEPGRRSYRYADLASVLEVVRPVLAARGLAVTQSASAELSKVTVSTTVVHTSGEWLTFPPLTMQMSGVDPQSVGAGITYARRYSLMAVLGIAAEEDDDDGAAASTQPTRSTESGDEPDWGALGYADRSEHDDRLVATNELAAGLPAEAREALRAEYRALPKPMPAAVMAEWEARVESERARWVSTEPADDWPTSSLDQPASSDVEEPEAETDDGPADPEHDDDYLMYEHDELAEVGS